MSESPAIGEATPEPELCTEHFSPRRDNEHPPICKKAFAKGLYPCEFPASASPVDGATRPKGCTGGGSGGYPPSALHRPACSRCGGAGIITIQCPGPASPVETEATPAESEILAAMADMQERASQLDEAARQDAYPASRRVKEKKQQANVWRAHRRAVDQLRAQVRSLREALAAAQRRTAAANASLVTQGDSMGRRIANLESRLAAAESSARSLREEPLSPSPAS